MKISKGLKIGLIVGSSVLIVGGGALMFVGGMATYQGFTYEGTPIDASYKPTTAPRGIGLFNFDNKTKQLQTFEKKYDDLMQISSKYSQVEKDAIINEMKSNIAEAEKLVSKDWGFARDQAQSSLAYFEALMNMPTMHALAITGVVFLPIGLILLIGAILLKAKPKAE